MNWYKKILAQTYQEIMDYPGAYSDPDDPEHYNAIRYFSIGQGNDVKIDDNYCWLFDGRKLHVKQGGTYAMNFPRYFSWEKTLAPNMYRGWFDPEQQLISVIIPRIEGQADPAFEASSLPTKLRVALSDAFDSYKTDNKIVVF